MVPASWRSHGSLRRGDRGAHIAALREVLHRVGFRPATPAANAEPLGAVEFDADVEQAVRAFQQTRGLVADGVVGEQTTRVLDGARWRLGDRLLRHLPGRLMRGDDVAALQERLTVLGVLGGPVDGAFGAATEAALRDLQTGLGLDPDGVCGPATIRALGMLARAVEGGDPWALRQQAEVAVAGKSLAGKVVVIDPSGGAGEPGATYQDASVRVVEADVVLDVARRVERRLAATGASVVLTRDGGSAPSVGERAGTAVEVGADVLLSLQCDAVPSPAAHGVATFYWGDHRVGARSAVGHRLATLVQREIVARTDLLDCRTHACTVDIVRLTRMPAVQVALGYLSHPGDAARLADPAFRDTLAEALVVAVQRLYLGEDDAATGTLDLRDVLAHAGRGGAVSSTTAGR